MSRELFIPQSSGTLKHSSQPCPVASGSLEGQVHPILEEKLSYEDISQLFHSHMVQIAPELGFLLPKGGIFQNSRLLHRTLLIQCHPPNIRKILQPSTALALNSIGKQLAMRNGDLPPKKQKNKGAGMSVARVSVFCWREADRHQKPLLSLMCGPQETNRRASPSSAQVVICNAAKHGWQITDSTLGWLSLDLSLKMSPWLNPHPHECPQELLSPFS